MNHFANNFSPSTYSTLFSFCFSMFGFGQSAFCQTEKKPPYLWNTLPTTSKCQLRWHYLDPAFPFQELANQHFVTKKYSFRQQYISLYSWQVRKNVNLMLSRGCQISIKTNLILFWLTLNWPYTNLSYLFCSYSSKILMQNLH